MTARRAAVGVALLALALTSCVSRESGAPEAAASSDEPTGSSSESAASTGECGYVRDEADSTHFVGLPPEDEPLDATALTLTTSAGAITVQLDADGSPCTVRSIAFLAEEGFYDGLNCHRITASASLKVLQCGDPNGDGTGGPGYAIPDELDTAAALPPSQSNDGTVTYTRGVVAMANAGPDTGGSQFFLVYGDSVLTPDYAVFGAVDQAGLTTLDQIAAAGLVPGENGPEDGAPTTPVTITKAQVS